MKLKLSPFERVLLINQFEIRKATTKDKDTIEWLERMIEVLESGYEFYYRELVERFSSFEEDESRFVMDVLDMYRRIEDYKGTNPKDDEIHKMPWSHFFGFDGNNESKYLGFVRFLFKQKSPELWVEQRKYAKKTDGYNSHMPTLDIYRRMLAKLESFGSPITLSREQVLAILAEAAHPESRSK